MKNTTTSSILTKACLLALILSATSYAQTHYDWTMSDNVAEWGSGLATAGGTYTRDHVSWSGANVGKSGAIVQAPPCSVSHNLK